MRNPALSSVCLGLAVSAGIAPPALADDAGAVSHVSVADPNIAYSPFNWFQNNEYAQSPNPGAYLKMGFTGTSLSVHIDVSPETAANVPNAHYPLIRYSVDNKRPVTVQLTPATRTISCASRLANGNHTFLLQYVAGYVFLDFWTPVNVLRITGFTLDVGASTSPPSGAVAIQSKTALFYGDSITNGDNTVTTFTGGVTNDVDTQDATVGYVQPVAAALRAEYGIIAYGGASWHSNAADGHTPGLMTFWNACDASHSRLSNGKLNPIPNDVFINMGENAGPAPGEVSSLLTSLRAASSADTNIWVIIPFSGRARAELAEGVAAYQRDHHKDSRVHLLDIGDSPYLTNAGETMMAVDGQHPTAALNALLAAQLVQARQEKLSTSGKRHR
jgi:hypothetical protein